MLPLRMLALAKDKLQKTLYFSKKAVAEDHLLIYFLGSPKMTKKHLQLPSCQSPSSLSTLPSARAAEDTMILLEPHQDPRHQLEPRGCWGCALAQAVLGKHKL